MPEGDGQSPAVAAAPSSPVAHGKGADDAAWTPTGDIGLSQRLEALEVTMERRIQQVRGDALLREERLFRRIDEDVRALAWRVDAEREERCAALARLRKTIGLQEGQVPVQQRACEGADEGGGAAAPVAIPAAMEGEAWRLATEGHKKIDSSPASEASALLARLDALEQQLADVMANGTGTSRTSVTPPVSAREVVSFHENTPPAPSGSPSPLGLSATTVAAGLPSLATSAGRPISVRIEEVEALCWDTSAMAARQAEATVGLGMRLDVLEQQVVAAASASLPARPETTTGLVARILGFQSPEKQAAGQVPTSAGAGDAAVVDRESSAPAEAATLVRDLRLELQGQISSATTRLRTELSTELRSEIDGRFAQVKENSNAMGATLGAQLSRMVGRVEALELRRPQLLMPQAAQEGVCLSSSRETSSPFKTRSPHKETADTLVCTFSEGLPTGGALAVGQQPLSRSPMGGISNRSFSQPSLPPSPKPSTLPSPQPSGSRPGSGPDHFCQDRSRSDSPPCTWRGATTSPLPSSRQNVGTTATSNGAAPPSLKQLSLQPALLRQAGVSGAGAAAAFVAVPPPAQQRPVGSPSCSPALVHREISPLANGFAPASPVSSPQVQCRVQCCSPVSSPQLGNRVISNGISIGHSLSSTLLPGAAPMGKVSSAAQEPGGGAAAAAAREAMASAAALRSGGAVQRNLSGSARYIQYQPQQGVPGAMPRPGQLAPASLGGAVVGSGRPEVLSRSHGAGGL